jgi:hypothetical protein
MVGTQAKKERNEDLVKTRDSGMKWDDVATKFDLSVARAKEIYYRETRKGAKKNKKAVNNKK